MKQLIKIASLIGIFAVSQIAYPGSIADTYETGDTLTATTLDNIKSAVNNNDARMSSLESISSASAESFMTCASGNGDGIKAISVPASISAVQCPPFGNISCADCIISLETQGCELVKVVTTHLMNPTIGSVPATTYLLSCVDP